MVSVLGVVLGGVMKRRHLQRLREGGLDAEQARRARLRPIEKTPPNWWILGGGLAFVAFTISMGLSEISYNKEIIFVGSMAIVLFLMSRLVKVLKPEDRLILVGTAVIIFIYRAMPTPGAGQTWWMIDELGFDQQFLAVLSLISSVLTLFGMFIFRRFMAERSIAYVIVFLTIASTVLYMPIVGMFYGLHIWTAAADRRHRRCALHCIGRYGAGIAAGSDRDDPDARLDREFRARQPQGDLLRGDGVLHQSGAVGEPARHQVPQSDLYGYPRSPRPHDRCDHVPADYSELGLADVDRHAARIRGAGRRGAVDQVFAVEERLRSLTRVAWVCRIVGPACIHLGTS